MYYYYYYILYFNIFQILFSNNKQLSGSTHYKNLILNFIYFTSGFNTILNFLTIKAIIIFISIIAICYPIQFLCPAEKGM